MMHNKVHYMKLAENNGLIIVNGNFQMSATPIGDCVNFVTHQEIKNEDCSWMTACHFDNDELVRLLRGMANDLEEFKNNKDVEGEEK